MSMSASSRQGWGLAAGGQTYQSPQINYCGVNTNCNNWPGYYECNEDDCKPGYVNWRANVGKNQDQGVDRITVNN